MEINKRIEALRKKTEWHKSQIVRIQNKLEQLNKIKQIHKL